MKASVMNQIYATPLTYPYFDEQALRAVEPMDVRFRISTLEVTEKIAEEYGFSLDRVPEMLLAQFQAGRHITQKMKSIGLSSVAAAEMSGMNKTMLSKYFQVRKAKTQMALYEKQNPRDIANAPHRDLSEMIGERIFELSDDKGTQSYQLFGQETPYGVRNYIRQFIIEDFKRESPRMSLLMYLAFETGLALDYFVAEDFTKMVPCFYKSGDEVRELKDQDSAECDRHLRGSSCRSEEQTHR